VVIIVVALVAVVGMVVDVAAVELAIQGVEDKSTQAVDKGVVDVSGDSIVVFMVVVVVVVGTVIHLAAVVLAIQAVDMRHSSNNGG
jgi:hypothetical protein